MTIRWGLGVRKRMCRRPLPFAVERGAETVGVITYAACPRDVALLHSLHSCGQSRRVCQRSGIAMVLTVGLACVPGRGINQEVPRHDEGMAISRQLVARTVWMELDLAVMPDCRRCVRRD